MAVALVALGLGSAASAQSVVRGVVTDSIHAQPLVGATVVATPGDIALDSLFHSTITDARGRFTLMGLTAGRYSLTVEHPSIDSTAIGVPPLDVTTRAHDTVVVALAIPSAASVRRAFCRPASGDSAIGVLLGAVRTPSGNTASGAVVVISWSDFDVDRTTLRAVARKLTTNVLADSVGVYRACGLPVARTLFVQAQLGEALQSGVLEEQIGPAGVLVRDLRVGAVERAATAASADSLAPLGRYLLTGRVLNTDGGAVSSASVQLFGTLRSTKTMPDGSFRLTGLPGGTQGIEVIALGYYPRRLRAEVGEQGAALTIRLERAAAVLDSIRITAKRVNSPKSGMYREFDERARVGQGTFITEEQIDQRRPFVTTDLFRTLPGYKINTPRLGGDAITIVSTHGTGFSSECVMNVFLDGVEIRPEDANIIPPSAVHGIEVYDVATSPAKYHKSHNCGIVLIWTK